MKPIEDLRKIHIVGVAGSATSGLARILRARGVAVSGSDQSRAGLEGLRRAGVETVSRHCAENLDSTVDLVVHSAAVPRENSELHEARRRGIPVCKFAEFLGALVETQHGLAIAGTHGKTTTAGMLASIFIAAGRDPSFLIGGEHTALGSNWRHGTGRDFILEACEFDRSFHSFRPAAGLITAFELDHPDIYRDETMLLEAFQGFVSRFMTPGLLVINGDAAALDQLDVDAGIRRVTFGFSEHCDWRGELLEDDLTPNFEVHRRSDGSSRHQRWGRLRLSIPGRHNVANALAAVALAAELGVSRRAIAKGLAEFQGIARRYQVRGETGGVTLVDDYAHHPTEVRCTLRTTRAVHPGRRVVAVFQPHQFGRLQAFGDGFADALGEADCVALLPVYSVRENPKGFPPGLLVGLEKAIQARGAETLRLPSPADAAWVLTGMLREGDVCVLLGAGDVVRLTHALEASLKWKR